MADVLFISENYLKTSSVINDNADMKILTPTLIWVQDSYVQSILGTDLFEEIKTQINTSSVSANNTYLLDNFLLKIIVNYTLMESTPEFKNRYMNKGLMNKSSDNSQSIDAIEMQYEMDRWRSRAEFYSERLRTYLRKNLASYPLYSSNMTYEKIKPNRQSYTTGIFLEGLSDSDDCNILIGNY